MGIVDLPTIDMYFEKDFVTCPLILNTMTAYRFNKISQYLHLSDNDKKPKKDDDDYDALYKVRPALHIIEKFSKIYIPGKNLSVDEAMIAFKGRFFAKQYMPAKPTQWGIKAWCCAESETGYLLDCDIYLGKKKNDESDYLLGEKVVLNMMKKFFNENHHVFFDNFFTSARLMDQLLEKGTYSAGTVRSNRKGLPEEFKKPKSLKMKAGEFKQMQRGDITATVWHDKRDVYVLSTNCNPLETVPKVRRSSKKSLEKVEVQCPLPIKIYNDFMGGVDLSDQKRSYYSVGKKNKKFWKYIFHFIINVCIVNSFIIYLQSNPITKKYTQLDYRKNLIKQLIQDFTAKKPKKAINFENAISTSNKFSHKIVKIEGRNKKCVLCKKNNVTTHKGNKVETGFKCENCDLPLCKVSCFPVHQNLLFTSVIHQ